MNGTLLTVGPIEIMLLAIVLVGGLLILEGLSYPIGLPLEAQACLNQSKGYEVNYDCNGSVRCVDDNQTKDWNVCMEGG